VVRRTVTENCDLSGAGSIPIGHRWVVQVFEFSCGTCGPFCVIPIQDVRLLRRGGDLPPRRCSECGGPILIDVVYDYDAECAALPVAVLPSAGLPTGALPGVARLEHRLGNGDRSCL